MRMTSFFFAPSIASGSTSLPPYEPREAYAARTAAALHAPPLQAHYEPVDYEDDVQDVSPEEFYGSYVASILCEVTAAQLAPNRLLIDERHPTNVFRCMTDALYFVVDTQCEIVALRNSGVVEPEKYIWLLGETGSSVQEVRSKVVRKKHLILMYHSRRCQ